MRVALEDANFYNSRFKNALIARIYPIVEVSYMEMLGKQQHRMRIMLSGMAILAIVMVVVALLLFKQTRALSRSRA